MHVALGVWERASRSLEVLLERAKQIRLRREEVTPRHPGSYAQVHRRLPELRHRDEGTRVVEHPRIGSQYVQARAYRDSEVVVVTDADNDVDSAGVVRGEVLYRRAEDL